METMFNAQWILSNFFYTGFLDLVLPTDMRSSSLPTSADSRIKYSSRRSIFLHSNDMAEPVQDINALHNVYVFEEFIQLTIESNAEIIDNSHWTEELTQDFSLEYSQGCSVFNRPLRHKEHGQDERLVEYQFCRT